MICKCEEGNTFFQKEGSYLEEKKTCNYSNPYIVFNVIGFINVNISNKSYRPNGFNVIRIFRIKMI